MKNALILCLLVLLTGGGIYAAPIHKSVIENGGPGPYKAIVLEESWLKDYTIVRPERLSAVAEIEGPLPVVLFGNGGCSRDSGYFLPYMTHLASYGYIVISNGMWDAQGKSTAATDEEKRAESAALLLALDRLEAQNGKKKSGYYQCADTRNVAVAGQSCGGLQALYLSSLGDARIRATILLNSGLFTEEGAHSNLVGKESLSSLSAPVLYLLGGESDIAYSNGVDDFRRIDRVPVVFASKNVGHGGTFGQPGGGRMAEMSRYWLDYCLKGNKDYDSLFRFAQLPDAFDGWYMTAKNFQRTKEIVLSVGTGENQERIDYDEFGHRQTIHAVSSPGIEVFQPAAGKENGTGVLVFPGGGLFNLAWETELHTVANFLNAKGVTVIGVKYRTRTDPRDPDAMGRAAEDALAAMRYAKAHAGDWNIDPDKIGWMGFSAGGMVQTAALMTKASADDMPFFLCSVYGPSGADIVVPEKAPKLFVSVHADHPNVFALCQTLFSEWKKAGKDAEMHIWGYNTGGHFCLGKQEPDQNTIRGSWMEPLYGWLVANGFVPREE